MSLKTQRSLRNALLNRVRRHATIATIFNAPDPVHPLNPFIRGTGSLPKNEVLGGADLVQATLLSLPAHLTNSSPGELIPYVSGEASITESTPQKVSKPPARIEPTVFQSNNSFENITNQGKAFTPGDSDEEDDSTWRKLKTIFRKHKEKDGQEVTTPRPKPSAANHLQRELDKPGNLNTTSKDLSISPATRLDTTQTPVEHKPDTHAREDTSSQSGLENDHQNERYGQTSHPLKLSTEKPIVESVDQPHPEYQEGLQKRNSVGSGEILKEKEEETADHVFPSNINKRESTLNEDVSPDPTLHTVPLEAAWPVQKQEIHPVHKPKPVESLELGEVDTGSDNPLPNPDFQTLVGAETIQRALKNVVPGQPTSSSVELIIPRRPRPHSPDRVKNTGYQKTPEVQESSTQPAHPKSTPFQTDLPPEVSPGWGTEKLSGEDPFPGRLLDDAQPEVTSRSSLPTVPPDRPLVDGEPDSQVNSPNELNNIDEIENDTEPELVQTDIGPLPVDLWQILNHDAPTTFMGGGTFTEPPPIKTSRPADVKRKALSPDTRKDSPESTQSAKQKIVHNEVASIQRAVSTDDNSNVTSSTSIPESVNETNPDGETSQNTEPDIDELSRQVYAEIRRQLMVEWERSRNRN